MALSCTVTPSRKASCTFELGGLLPGIKVQTSATDFAPLSQLQLMRFKGEKWDLFGDIISGDVGG